VSTKAKAARADADQFIGRRIRECRTALGLNQRQFAVLIGVSYQQAHKYERGINSVTAGRLYEIAGKLRVPPEYFFEGLERSEYRLPPRQRRLLEVMRHIGEIKSDKRRDAINQVIRALTGS
jgi:transcriptional regulator with XRE-family HTH domain